MNHRNLYGFALFTLIIISTVLVKFTFFTAQPVLPSPNIYVETATGTRADCFPKIKEPIAKFKIEQAVVDFKTKTVNVEFDLKRRADFDVSDGADVTLNFFIKDSSAPRRISDDGVWAITTFSANDLTQLKMGGDYVLRGFLRKNNFRPGQSLYVIPVIAPRQINPKPKVVNFDESEAIPVLVASDK